MIWLILALGIAIVDWIALVRGWRWLDYMAKPGVMGSLLVGMWSTLETPWSSGFTWGVLFSLAGDIFLMLPRERFIAGLTAFLFAHVAYIVGFTPTHLTPTWEIGLLAVVLGGLGLFLGKRILHGVRKRGNPLLTRAVGFYIGVITLMLFSAWTTWWQPQWSHPSAMLVGFGATFFLLSDAMLAWNRFVQPFPHARLKVRITYHLGQILLVWGVLLRAQTSLLP